MKYAFFTLAAALLLAGQSVAAVKYWDVNGATAGSGVVAASTTNWGTNNWSTDSTGSIATGAFTSGTDTAIFAAGTDGSVAYTVNLSSALTSTAVTVEEGTVTKTGAALSVQNITVNNGAGFFINASGALTVAAGGGLTLNGGTIGNSNPGSSGSFLGNSTANTNMPITLGTGGGHVSANGGAGIVTIETGLIQGTGPLVVDGNGIFRLTTTTATYSGATTINGTLQISTTANVLPAGTDLTIASGGKFDQQASQSVNSLAGSGALAFTNSATILTVSGSNDTAFSGAVTGAGTFTKTGASTITIGSDWANTGPTNINAGTIKFGSGAAGLSTASAVTINNGGTLDMNSIGDTFGSLNSTAGQTTGVVAMGSGNTLHLGQTATTGRSYDGKITGSGTLDKAGSTFTQTLNGDNSGFTGPITITLGKIAVGNVNALGTTAGNTAVASGAELLFDGAANSYSIAEPISIAGVGADGGAITVQNSSVTNLTGPITVSADATVTTSSSATATYSNANAFTANNFNLTVQGGSGAGGGGTISGAIALGTGSLTKLQGGKWTLTAANTYSGGTKIVDGALALGDKAALGTGTLSLGDTVTAPSTGVSLSSTTDLSGANAVANSVTVNRDFSVTGTNKLELSGAMNLGNVNRTVTVTNTADTIVSGVIGDGGSGTGALSKAGVGKLILTNGGNNYGGGTVVTAGTLLANNTTGSATGSGNIGVSGGVFGGTGAVTGAVTISGTGTLSPGASVETLDTGALTFLAGGTLKYEIDSSVALAAAADLLNANGGVSVGLSIASGSLLTLTDVANTPVTVPVGTRFTMISYAGSWDGGTFNGAADDSVVTIGGDYYVINYNDTNPGVNFGGGSFSNYVTLTAVPEVNASLLAGMVTLVVGVAVGSRKLFHKVASPNRA